MTIGIAGAGPVGQALGRRLVESGLVVAQVASRSLANAAKAAGFIGSGTEAVAYEELRCGRVLIAVKDSALAEVAGRIGSPEIALPEIALHTCGAYGSEVLATMRERGVACGAMHPLQTFPTAERGYGLLPGSAFAIEGDAAAVKWAHELVAVFAGTPLEIPASRRALYHAAAVMASNHVIAALDAACAILEETGTSEETALRALRPLAQASLDNAFEQGPTDALTGPAARGDEGTIDRHMRALERMPESVQELYRAATEQAREIARRRGAWLRR